MLDATASEAVRLVRNTLRAGWGSQVQVVRTARGPSEMYYRILEGVLRFSAYLDTASVNLASNAGVVFAIDSVSHPVGFEFVVGAGRICFVPAAEGASEERLGAAIASTAARLRSSRSSRGPRL